MTAVLADCLARASTRLDHAVAAYLAHCQRMDARERRRRRARNQRRAARRR